MISYKRMKQEMKRCEKLAKAKAIELDYQTAVDFDNTYWVLKWILETDDDD